MTLRTTFSTVPVALAALLLLVSCSDDPPAPPATGGTNSGGAASNVSGAAGTFATGGGGLGGGGGGGTSAGTGGGGAAAAGGGSGGSSAGSGGGATFPPTFATFKTEVLPACSGGLCHNFSEGENKHPFYFTDDANLYTALTTHQTKNCGPNITKGSPENSAMIKLLKGPCNGTDRMPYSSCPNDAMPGEFEYEEYCIKAPLIAALEEWIRNGAPEN